MGIPQFGYGRRLLDEITLPAVSEIRLPEAFEEAMETLSAMTEELCLPGERWKPDPPGSNGIAQVPYCVDWDRQAKRADCPRCSGRGHVTTSRPPEGSFRVRYHVCARCRYRFKSIEQL